jgi:hypothetical protein
MQGPPKFTQIRIFGLKKWHLATLETRGILADQIGVATLCHSSKGTDKIRRQLCCKSRFICINQVVRLIGF